MSERRMARVARSVSFQAVGEGKERGMSLYRAEMVEQEMRRSNTSDRDVEWGGERWCRTSVPCVV